MSRCVKINIAGDSECSFCEKRAVYKMQRGVNYYLCCTSQSCNHMANTMLHVELACSSEEKQPKARLF